MKDDSELEHRLTYARALEHMTEVLLTESDTPRVLEALARITCETLDVDRSLIYDVRLLEEQVVALCEWLNPAVDVTPTKGTYPLSAFAGGDREARRTRSWMESHSEQPHPALVDDGSAPVLHGQMSIRSLLWFPFDFREAGYYVLVFNQVTHRRVWLPHEIEFLRIATRHAALALMQIQLQAERAESQRVLLETQKAASISLLAGGVAHDFNGLLGIVLGVVGRARASLGPGHPLSSSLRDAERAAREAAHLATQLLAYAGGGRFVVETLDLAALVDEMQDLLRAAAGNVTVHFTNDGPSLVSGDAGQLRQVLVNFVVNAAEAIDEGVAGEIYVSVTRDPTDGDSSNVLLEVRDNGRGMAPEVQARIFEPFFTTKSFGRGLGLAAVSGIVRSHSGQLRMRSAPDQGTTLSASFPAVATAQAPRAAAPPSAEGTAGATLLLVDDSDNFRRMCASLLADLGYRTLEAGSGQVAVEVLTSHAHEIDAVVLDWTMPAPGGAETFLLLRSIRADLPIVIMSGYLEGDATELLRTGAAGFIEKPFTVEALGDVLRTVLAHSRPEASRLEP
jgi:signal transduction histidine kinase/ActR/RegA family two-component response regulator